MIANKWHIIRQTAWVSRPCINLAMLRFSSDRTLGLLFWLLQRTWLLALHIVLGRPATMNQGLKRTVGRWHQVTYEAFISFIILCYFVAKSGTLSFSQTSSVLSLYKCVIFISSLKLTACSWELGIGSDDFPFLTQLPCRCHVTFRKDAILSVEASTQSPPWRTGMTRTPPTGGVCESHVCQ